MPHHISFSITHVTLIRATGLAVLSLRANTPEIFRKNNCVFSVFAWQPRSDLDKPIVHVSIQHSGVAHKCADISVIYGSSDYAHVVR